MYIHLSLYIYIYTERKRERERERGKSVYINLNHMLPNFSYGPHARKCSQMLANAPRCVQILPSFPTSGTPAPAAGPYPFNICSNQQLNSKRKLKNV